MKPASSKATSSASFSATLHTLLANATESSIALGDMLGALGDKSFGLCLMLIALPSALPVYGLSVPLGGLMMVLGLQMALGFRAPLIPQRAQRLKIKITFLQKVLHTSERVLHSLEGYLKPRYSPMFQGFSYRMMGFLVFALAFIVFLPLPLTNTFPGLLIFVLGASLSQEDGLICLLWSIIATLTTLVYAAGGYIICAYGWTGLQKMKDAFFQVFS